MTNATKKFANATTYEDALAAFEELKQEFRNDKYVQAGALEYPSDITYGAEESIRLAFGIDANQRLQDLKRAA